MRTTTRGDSVEILIGDLIFKLGKANQQIHQLSQRVAQLEFLLQNQQNANFPSSNHPAHEKSMMAQ
ncbi:hypothetical protein [Lederbergia citrea]|uniref:Uncharacterized protein n=1 Tax=Lederbergia citrea TaxID=2833581 RepID=A0A942URE1_9BACI|nr:hypothetical protein [Lederbergia citrea]MBS4178083.1 hypothetical protein [Lederbergia citrea]MBS4204749.1 hypothetical protein [Lederbergia citrea]MBS4223403.1 hypothetical protein [Lederbergia citrea]